MLIFGKGASPLTHKGVVISREKAVQVLEDEEGGAFEDCDATLPRALFNRWCNSGLRRIRSPLYGGMANGKGSKVPSKGEFVEGFGLG